jgi:hypothetical protein
VPRCIPPPAPVANDNGIEGLHIPVDRANPLLTESHAVLSDAGSYADWLALAVKFREGELGANGVNGGLTGITRKKKRRVTR